ALPVPTVLISLGLRRTPPNQIANIDLLLVLEVSSGLHHAGCLGRVWVGKSVYRREMILLCFSLVIETFLPYYVVLLFGEELE
ncbi:hypothetical protein A2U01_0056527, partial [Trifolium medium]|nr:hypothetical protein [Trifolium medium]